MSLPLNGSSVRPLILAFFKPTVCMPRQRVWTNVHATMASVSVTGIWGSQEPHYLPPGQMHSSAYVSTQDGRRERQGKAKRTTTAAAKEMAAAPMIVKTRCTQPQPRTAMVIGTIKCGALVCCRDVRHVILKLSLISVAKAQTSIVVC